MIQKDQREKDRDICEAATGGVWIAVQPRSQEGGSSLGHFGPTWADEYPAATSVRMAGTRIRLTWEEHEANARAAVNAVNRLPSYIDAADEMERRIAEVDALATQAWKQAADYAAWGEHGAAAMMRDRFDALTKALRILRGQP